MFDNFRVGAVYGKAVCGDVDRNRRAGARRRVFAYFNRRDEVCVASDERVISDNRAEFVYSVIVRGNAAAAEIYVLSYVAVADVGEVGDAGLFADVGIFHFDKVTYFNSVADSCSGSDMYERSDFDVVSELRVIRLNVVERGAVADLGVLDKAVRSDNAAFSDHGFSSKYRVRINERFGADFYVFADYYSVGADKFNPVCHVLFDNAFARDLVQREEVRTGVRSEYYIGIFRAEYARF